MRNISNVSKKLSDSLLGCALIAAPIITTPPNALEHVALLPSLSETSSRDSSLGRFLENEVASRIERVSGRKLQTAVRVHRSREIASAVAEASYIHNVDPFLLLAMIEVESRYHVQAVGLHGELGLMQIKPTTARWIAPVTDALYDCDLHQVRCNIMMGASYVSHLQHRAEKQRYGKNEALAQTLALAPQFRQHVLRSYNLGPAKATRLAADREPATEGDVAPYALKIAMKADRMRHRYLDAALDHGRKLKRAPESISVAMIQ